MPAQKQDIQKNYREQRQGLNLAEAISYANAMAVRLDANAARIAKLERQLQTLGTTVAVPRDVLAAVARDVAHSCQVKGEFSDGHLKAIVDRYTSKSQPVTPDDLSQQVFQYCNAPFTIADAEKLASEHSNEEGAEFHFSPAGLFSFTQCVIEETINHELVFAAQQALDYIARIHGRPAPDEQDTGCIFVGTLAGSLAPYLSEAGVERNYQTSGAICELSNQSKFINAPLPPAGEHVEPPLASPEPVNKLLLAALKQAKNSLVAFKLMPGQPNAWEAHDEANLLAVNSAIAAAEAAQPVGEALAWVSPECLEWLKNRAKHLDCPIQFHGRTLPLGNYSIALYAQQPASAQLVAVPDGWRELVEAAIETLQWYANVGHVETLSGKQDWPAARFKMEANGFRFEAELTDGTEVFVEYGDRATKAVDKLRAMLSAAQKPEGV